MEKTSELFWVSRPDARHSQNITVRSQIAMVVFDSTIDQDSRQAVYMSAIAGQVTDHAQIERGVAVFTRESVRDGAGGFGIDEVTGKAQLRLYRASVQECWILDPDIDVRVGVPLPGHH
jgi:hypothetical protein